MGNNFFHILNRGVEKRKIFLGNSDYRRFVDNLRDFNDLNNALSYKDRCHLALREPSGLGVKKKKKEIIDILCWCLMPNHFHILTSEKINKGNSVFSQKLTSGHTQCFNLKNDRSGVLFQGRTKIIRLERNEHFMYLPYYILSNPIKLIEPSWKENGIKDFKKVVEFLEKYRWSSYLDIIGKNNFPEIINKKLFYEVYDTDEKRFKNDFIEWLKGFN